MRRLWLSAAALVWAVACGPRDRANRVGAPGDSANTGMTVDTAPPAGGPGAVVDTMPGGGGSSMDETAVLTTLSTANMQEIQEASYAKANASSAAVKALARKLEADHRANLEQSRRIASRLGISQRLPTDSAQSKAAPAKLVGVHGAALDSLFLSGQAEAHRANIDRIRTRMLPAARDPQLKRYLQQTLTAMEGHLQQIERTRQTLGRS